MRLRYLLAVSMLGGLTFLTGCPFAGLLDDLFSGASSDANVIPDGTYAGKSNSLSEWRDNGDLYWQGPDQGDTGATFAQGALVASSGNRVDIGDVDSVDRGTLQISREVSYVEIYDWGYEVDYDLTATWKNVPLDGVQYVTYELNDDGTVTMYDTTDLTSLDTYDGGQWTIHTTTTGTLASSVGGRSSGDSGGSNDSGGDILDKKSGKFRR